MDRRSVGHDRLAQRALAPIHRQRRTVAWDFGLERAHCRRAAVRTRVAFAQRGGRLALVPRARGTDARQPRSDRALVRHAYRYRRSTARLRAHFTYRDHAAIGVLTAITPRASISALRCALPDGGPRGT